jgi:hypothetical protein
MGKDCGNYTIDDLPELIEMRRQSIPSIYESLRAHQKRNVNRYVMSCVDMLQTTKINGEILEKNHLIRTIYLEMRRTSNWRLFKKNIESYGVIDKNLLRRRSRWNVKNIRNSLDI